MKKTLANISAKICSNLLFRLHNKKFPSLNREEIRKMGITFSFCAEDIVVLQRAKDLGIEQGVYIDVGAFDPIFCSNTLLLHKNGWHGINIDIDAAKVEKFQTMRPGDHNVLGAVSDTKEVVHYASYQSSSWNRIIDLECPDTKSKIGEEALSIIPIETLTLTEIIDNSIYRNAEIAYLDVDCEGYDLKVLKSLDFKKYKPRIISFEAHNLQDRSEISEFLTELNYVISDIVNITTICILEKH